nr:PREDICTED: odorant receptor Or2-like [Megachile rotundata]
MRQPSKDTIDYYIFPNKILCSMFGMWPSDKKRSTVRKMLAYLHFVFSVLTVCVIVVPEIILLAVRWRDLKIFAGAGCIIMSLMQVLFKTVYLTMKREEAHKLYTEFRSLWYLTKDPVERQSYELFAYWARTCTITFGVSCVGTMIIFFISATYDYITDVNMNAGSRHLPYDVCCMINVQLEVSQTYQMEMRGIDFIDSPEFEIIFVSQILASLFAACAVIGLDSTCVTIILHLSGQFRLITTWLSNIGIEMQYNRIDLHNCPPSVSADLIKCIRHHQRLIKVLQDVNSLLTPIIFMQVFTSSIVFCLGGYAIISNNAADDLFKFVSYILSMTIQLLLWCWPGEILIEESLHIGYAAYVNVPWYNLPPFYRRQLCLIVLRSQKTCSLSAFIFHSLSIYTLTNVLNTAFSYFALLRQIQDKNM